jgi:hypothetical protein
MPLSQDATINDHDNTLTTRNLQQLLIWGSTTDISGDKDHFISAALLSRRIPSRM